MMADSNAQARFNMVEQQIRPVTQRVQTPARQESEMQSGRIAKHVADQFIMHGQLPPDTRFLLLQC